MWLFCTYSNSEYSCVIMNLNPQDRIIKVSSVAKIIMQSLSFPCIFCIWLEINCILPAIKWLLNRTNVILFPFYKHEIPASRTVYYMPAFSMSTAKSACVITVHAQSLSGDFADDLIRGIPFGHRVETLGQYASDRKHFCHHEFISLMHRSHIRDRVAKKVFSCTTNYSSVLLTHFFPRCFCGWLWLSLAERAH